MICSATWIAVFTVSVRKLTHVPCGLLNGAHCSYYLRELLGYPELKRKFQTGPECQASPQPHSLPKECMRELAEGQKNR
jgi:hypothetical protein